MRYGMLWVPMRCAECGRVDTGGPRARSNPPWLRHPLKRGVWCGCELTEKSA
jgi:hypothetical protein